jgi:hypothetical protein
MLLGEADFRVFWGAARLAHRWPPSISRGWRRSMAATPTRGCHGSIPRGCCCCSCPWVPRISSPPPALVLGQVAVLWGAGVLAALAFLRDGRAVPAGVVLGLLTFKPQLGVLIAVALIASGQWRAMAVAALTAILFHGAATLVFGPGYWPALLDMAGQHAAIMRSDVAGAEFLVSPYSALVALGLPETLALALQWGLAAAALIAVALAWRTEGIGFDHKAALLVTAILIAPPYLWYGETALLAPALMLLIRAGLIRRTLPGAFLAILMALGVTPYLLAQLLIATEPVPMRLVAAPVLVVAFAVAARPVLARAIRRDGPT